MLRSIRNIASATMSLRYMNEEYRARTYYVYSSTGGYESCLVLDKYVSRFIVIYQHVTDDDMLRSIRNIASATMSLRYINEEYQLIVRLTGTSDRLSLNMCVKEGILGVVLEI